MSGADVSAVAQVWVREARVAGIELPWDDLELALRQLPRPAAFAVDDGATALFALGQSDTLFTLSAKDGRVSLTSRPLNGDRLMVSLEWSEAKLGTRATRWTFVYDDQRGPTEPWQIVSGSVSIDADTGHENIDEHEHFARMLATRAGWAEYPAAPLVPQPAPEAQEAEAAQPRWRAMTDVWGKPLPQRRR